MADVPSNLIPTRITQLPVAPVASPESLLLIVYEGNNYQIAAGDLLQVAGVPTSRQVIAGTGLSGGGALSSNVTLSIAPGGVGPSQLANTGAAPGTYGSATQIPVFTVDAQGRVTATSSVSVAPPSNYVPNTRQVIAGTGLSGGGPLNNNVTLAANLSNATPLVASLTGSAGSSSEISRADHRHPAVNLADTTQVDGVLGLSHGGTARSLVPNAGAVIWCGADGLYVGPVGTTGKALLSGGTSQYTWGDVVTSVNGETGVVVLTYVDVGAPGVDGTNAVGTWGIDISGNAATATLAASATNLAGGAANKLPYQTGVNTTAFINAPVAGDTFLKWTGSGYTWAALPGAGTVTSVGLALPGEFTISNSPVTSSGTLTGAWASQAANYFLAAPNGSPGVPSFRALMAADVPTLNQNTTGSAASLSVSGQTGLFSVTGLTSTNRVKTVRDADDTLLELGGSYTPSGTWNWTSATATWPTFNQNTTGQAGSVANSVTFNSSGGAAPNTSFDGSTARTVDYSTVGAPKADGTGASGTWSISVSGNAGTATSATTATNLAAGAANQIAYQTGAGATSFISAPTVASTYLEWSGSAFQWSANPLGTVTSVGLALPAEFTISNSPVTTSGTLTGAWANQTTNYVFAGPATGSATAPAFRALVDGDIPAALTGKSYNGVTPTALSTGWKASGGVAPVEVSFLGGAAYSITGTNSTAITLPGTSGTVALDNQQFYIGTTQVAINRASASLSLTGVSIDGSAGSVANSVTFDSSGTGGASPQTFNGSAAVTISRNTLGAAASGANGDITSMSGLTGGISSPDYVQFDTGATVTPAVGRVWWDGGSTLQVGMTANVTGQVAETLFIYIKASAAITKGQVIVQDGSVGASGVLKGKPAPLATSDAITVLGIAAESLSLNSFGLVQVLGYLRGFDTSGSSVGETWVDGDLLYYNPAYVGGLTKVKPNAPNLKLPMCEVVTAASGGSGEVLVIPGSSSVLGGTDSNVQFGTLNNGDVIVYNSTSQYWANVAQSSLTAGAASNLASGAVNQIPYQTGSGATSFITAPTVANTYLEWSGSAFQWSTNPLGTVTSVGLALPAEFTISNSPVTATGTLTGAWANQTANYVFAGPATGSAATPSFRALVAADIPTLNQNTTGSAASLSISGQTGLLTFTGLTSTNRTKTVRDAADTILELGGSYTPSGTWNWTSATATWPTFNQNTTGTAANATNVAVTNDASTNATMYPVWVTANTGNLPAKVTSSKLSFNPSTGVLTVTGGISGGTF